GNLAHRMTVNVVAAPGGLLAAREDYEFGSVRNVIGVGENLRCDIARTIANDIRSETGLGQASCRQNCTHCQRGQRKRAQLVERLHWRSPYARETGDSMTALKASPLEAS